MVIDPPSLLINRDRGIVSSHPDWLYLFFLSPTSKLLLDRIYLEVYSFLSLYWWHLVFVHRGIRLCLNSFLCKFCVCCLLLEQCFFVTSKCQIKNEIKTQTHWNFTLCSFQKKIMESCMFCFYLKILFMYSRQHKDMTNAIFRIWSSE